MPASRAELERRAQAAEERLAAATAAFKERERQLSMRLLLHDGPEDPSEATIKFPMETAERICRNVNDALVKYDRVMEPLALAARRGAGRRGS